MSVQHWSRLENVDPDLVRLVWDVGTYRDVDVAVGARTLPDEEAAIASGHSSLMDPTKSKHVIIPGVRDVAEAVDLTPFPVNWLDIEAFENLGAFVKDRATALGVAILWGGDWLHLHDYDHFEKVA
jgi:D-alanyl-D-alanine carboxypeptidase